MTPTRPPKRTSESGKTVRGAETANIPADVRSVVRAHLRRALRKLRQLGLAAPYESNKPSTSEIRDHIKTALDILDD